jgi:mannitol/fructose-specific phosphotransferase system IIA component (Ntr-type)
MRLKELFDPDLINLRLDLKELVSMLGLDKKSAKTLHKMFWRRQNLGSTGVGNGIAFVFTRTKLVDRLRLGFGRQPEGVDFKAMDNKPVFHFFLILAPPIETASQFLPAFGKLAQLSREPDFGGLLSKPETTEEFLDLMDSKDI